MLKFNQRFQIHRQWGHVEGYDGDKWANSSIIRHEGQLCLRGFLGEFRFGGFIITGSAPKHVLLRAIGPSLAQFGVPNVLADPMLERHGSGAFVTITITNDKTTRVKLRN